MGKWGNEIKANLLFYLHDFLCHADVVLFVESSSGVGGRTNPVQEPVQDDA